MVMETSVIPRKLFLTGLFLLCFMCPFALAESNTSVWNRCDSVVQQISGCAMANMRPKKSIAYFGAKQSNEADTFNCKPAFDRAMRYAEHSRQGLYLIVPKGRWFVGGPIHLVSHLTLELQEGAVLLFSSRPDDYLPVVETSWEGAFCYNYSPFIYGYQLEDVAIIGKGVLDGNCAHTFPTWRDMQKADQLLLRWQDHQQVPVAERLFGAGHYLRPHFIQLYNCRNLTLDGFKITNSPFWCVHLLKSENIICRNLRFDAKLVNNDGIDPEMSRNILIEGIEFNNGDDNVAIKAGRDNDGWAGCPSENIVIRRCRFKGLHGLVIGSEMSAGVRYVYVDSCTYGGYNKRALYVKTNPNRGGFVHDIYFRNCRFGEVEDLFYITSLYAGEGMDDNYFTDIFNIGVEDVQVDTVRNAAIVLQGTAAKPMHGIRFERVNVGHCAIGFTSEHAPDVVLSDCQLGGTVSAIPSQASAIDAIWSKDKP